MKTCDASLLFLALALTLVAMSCSKEAKTDASQPLKQSFATAEPELKGAIETAAASLKAGQYTEATKALAPVVTGRPLTDAQRQAVGAALHQINQAITANPSLDTKEMYELRAKMYRAVDGGP